MKQPGAKRAEPKARVTKKERDRQDIIEAIQLSGRPVHRYGLVVAVLLIAALIFGLIGLKMWAQSAAKAYEEARSHVRGTAQVIIGELAAASKKVTLETASADGSLKKALQQASIKATDLQVPALLGVPYGEFVSTSYSAAKAEDVNAAIVQFQDTLRKLEDFSDFQGKLHNIIHEASRVSTIDNRKDAKIVQKNWQRGAEKAQALSSNLTGFNDVRQVLVKRMKAVADYSGKIAASYESNNRPALEKSAAELESRLKAVRQSADTLTPLGERLGAELKRALRSLE